MNFYLTCSPIKAGEEITISYLIPPEQTQYSRTSKLKLQFGFEPVYNKTELFKIKMLETAKNPEQDNSALLVCRFPDLTR